MRGKSWHRKEDRMSDKKMTITIEVEGGKPQATIRCVDLMS